MESGYVLVKVNKLSYIHSTSPSGYSWRNTDNQLYYKLKSAGTTGKPVWVSGIEILDVVNTTPMNCVVDVSDADYVQIMFLKWIIKVYPNGTISPSAIP